MFARALHTSCVAQASARKQATSVVRRKNIVEQANRAKAARLDRPSVVLGTRPSEEATRWPSCDLAKVLVDEDALFSPASSSTFQSSLGTIHIPAQPAFGISTPAHLFDHLPAVSAQATISPSTALVGSGQGILHDSARLAMAEEREVHKANAFSRVVDLRNANAAGIAFENRRRIVEAFSTPANPFDPGRSEVQAALKTYQIRKLWKHLTVFKRDVGNRLGLRKLVHERAKILRYLRNTNRDRYEVLLERLALDPEAVEGELVV